MPSRPHSAKVSRDEPTACEMDRVLTMTKALLLLLLLKELLLLLLLLQIPQSRL